MDELQVAGVKCAHPVLVASTPTAPVDPVTIPEIAVLA
jgi:hypothetical protein